MKTEIMLMMLFIAWRTVVRYLKWLLRIPLLLVALGVWLMFTMLLMGPFSVALLISWAFDEDTGYLKSAIRGWFTPSKHFKEGWKP